MKRLVMFMLGATLAGVGIGMALSTGLGADPITVLFNGLSRSLNISVGMASNLVLVVLAFMAWLMNPKLIGWGTLISPFCIQFGIDTSMAWMPEITSFPFNYGMMFLGLLVIALGIAMAIQSSVGQQGTDAFILALSEKMNWSYYQVRWITDSTYLVLGVLLGGQFTPATIIAVLVLGRLIQFMQSFIKI